MRRRRRLVTPVSIFFKPSTITFLCPCSKPNVLLLLQLQLNSLIAKLVIEMKFETGDEKLKDLETGVFVGAGRFVVEKGKPVVVEYKISKAAKGN